MSAAVELTHAEEASEFELANSPGHLIHRAQQFAADCYMETAGRDVLTQRQFAVLATVADNEGLTQTDLIRATGIDRSTLADLVARMATKDLIERERAPHDGRANLVRITQNGRSALESLRPQVAKADQAILDALPKSKRASFLDALQRLTEVLDGLESGDVPAGGKKAAKADKKQATSAKANGKAAKGAKKKKAKA